MINLLKSLIRRAAAKPDDIKARFDLAQTTSQNRKHWGNADSLAARAAMSPAVRSIVRKRSRYEADNNSWYSGILSTAANHVIGNGPKLQVLTQNEIGNARIEQAWERWQRSIMFADKLRTLFVAYWKDGDGIGMRSHRPANWPFSLDVAIFESEQCASPWISSAIADPFLDDGIRIDHNANPVEYYLFDHHPGETAFVPTMNGRWYPAADMIHLFRRDRPGQVRGIPRATSALPTLPVMRRQEMATLLASETAASFATFLKSNAPALAPSSSPADFAEIEIAFNMLTTRPAGWEIDQVDSKHPGPQYEMFQRQALMSFARCTNMPYPLAAGSSMKSNFSSMKADIKNCWEPEVRTERNRIELCVVEKVFQWFLEDAIYVPGLLNDMPPIHQIDHQWFWEPLPNLDEVDAATAAQIRITSGQSSPSAEYAKRGLDYATEVEKSARDFGVDVATYKAAVFTAAFSSTGAPITPAGPIATPGAQAGLPGNELDAEAGEYTTIGQRHFNNNMRRIKKALEAFVAGEESRVMTEQTLQTIGLSQKRIETLIDDVDPNVEDDENDDETPVDATGNSQSL